MLDLVRPKLEIPDDNKIGINKFKNPYLTKLTIKALPQYSKVTGPTFFNPLQSYSNIAIVQSLPLWRNQKFRIGLLWQQNIRNSFNRSHIGFSAQYQMNRKYVFRTRNLVGNSFISFNQLAKTMAISGRLITLSAFYSSFYEDSTDFFHSIGAGICLDNMLSINVNKRIGAETGLKVNYQKPLGNDIFLRLRYDTQFQKLYDSTCEIGLGYRYSKNSSTWLKTALQSDKLQQNVAVQFEYSKNKSSHTFLGSVQLRNQKSIIYLGYKCPSFNFIFPIFGTDSVIPAIVAIGVFAYGYFKRKKHGQQQQNEIFNQQAQQPEKNRFDQLKLISEKANQNYKRQQILKGLLIEEVYVGQKNLLQKFLAQNNRALKLNRQQQYKTGIWDATVSFRFYVQKSQLSIPKGNKLTMIGFYYRAEEDQQVQIYVRYQKNGKLHQQIFRQSDAIKL